MSKFEGRISLEDRGRAIVEALGGTWSRSRGMCRCPAHADRTPSLSISLGRRAILVHCFAGCTNDAVIEALGKAGVRVSDLFDSKGCDLPVAKRDDAADRNAQRLWREASILSGSPAERYLAARGISFSSSDLRFHPRMPLGPKGSVQFLPAMVAPVRNDAKLLALHRTFLEPTGSSPADFERPKRALGSLGTGAVRLAFPRAGHLGLAEGIETALSAIQLFGIPCWATLGNERFGLVTIPESVRELHLFIDNDAGGALAESRARDAYASDGRRIIVRHPPQAGDDWNDVLKRRVQPATN